MSEPKVELSQLVPVLFAKTRAGKLKWESIGDDSVLADLGKFKISLTSGRFGTYVTLLDGDLRSLETSTEPAGAIKALYQMARRDALGVDDALKDVKSVLDKL